MSLGSLVIELQANVARLESDMGRAATIAESKLKVIDLAAARTAKNIENMAAAGGNARNAEGIANTAKEVENLGFKSVGARRELLVLAHEISQGNWKRASGSVQVLGERLDIMGKIMSPVGLSIAAAVGIIALFTAGVIKGAIESEHFAKSLLLTGNYAGLTEGSFNKLAESSATAAKATIGDAREMAQAFVSSGRFSGDALNSVTLAALKLQEATGQNADEVAKDFLKMSDGVLKWAVEMNRQYHFVDGALYDHIKTLEDQGKKEEAETVASDALYSHLGGSAVENVGLLTQAWHFLKQAMSDTKDELLAIGRTTTVEDQIKEVRGNIAQIRNAQAGAAGGINSDIYAGQLNQQNGQLSRLTANQRNQQSNADLTATRKKHDDQVVEAKQFWDRFTAAHHTGAEQLQKQLDEVSRNGALAGASPSDIAAAQDKIRKEFAPKGGGGGVAHADFESQVKPLEDQVKAEDQILSQREKMLTKYYKTSQLSMADYYGGQEYAIQEATKNITALYDQQIKAAESFASHAKAGSARINANTQAQSLRDRRDSAVSGLNEKADVIQASQHEDMEKYAEEVARVNGELAKLHGNMAESAGSNFDKSNRNVKDRATAENDAPALASLAALRQAEVEQAQMNELKQKAAEIEQTLQLATQRVNLETSTGQKGDLAGMVQIGQLRQQSVQQLAQIEAQMEQIAQASGIKSMTDQADQFKLKVDEMAQSTNVVGKTFNDIFANSFANMLDKSITGTKSLKQNFIDMANSIEQAITHIVSTDLANQLFGIAGQGDQSSGGGGMIGQLLGLAVGFLGGSSGGVTSDALSAPDWSTMPGRATGGPTAAGGVYQVNENGPELLTMANRTYLMMGDTPGKVSPMGSGGGSGSGSPVFNMNIAVPAGTTRQTAQQQASEIMRSANIAMARNN